MSVGLAGLVLPPLVGAAMLLLSGPLLRRLPEPADAPAGEEPCYAALATRGFGLLVGLASLLATVVVVFRLAAPMWPVWFGLCTIGVLLGCIDARTMWLPLRLTHPLWALTTVGLVITAVVVGWPAGLRMLLGAAAGFGFWWLIWRFGGLGFGDVRLAPVLGAAAAVVSWPMLFWATLAGALLGAVHGLGHRAAGRTGRFPYGPSLLAGQFLALLLLGG